MSTDLPISDEYLETSWYRIKSENGDQMPTYPPGSFHCGTKNPIWMKGKKDINCKRSVMFTIYIYKIYFVTSCD